MGRIAVIAFLLAVLAACAQYSLVEANKQKIGGTYTVEAQIAWSKHSEGKVEIWTVDGPALEAVRFFKGLDDGDSLFKRPRGSGEKVKYPTYKTGMTPNDVMELTVDSIARAGAGEVQASKLRPARFGSVQGFRFELTFLSKSGLEMDGLVAGAAIEDKLYLILYTGARIHYYPKYRDHVEQLLGSIEMI